DDTSFVRFPWVTGSMSVSHHSNQHKQGSHDKRLAIMFKSRVAGLLLGPLALGLSFPVKAPAQNEAATPLPKVVVEADGTVEIPAQSVPISTFLSPGAKAYLTQHLKDMQD